jgi:hypothetical protein
MCKQGPVNARYHSTKKKNLNEFKCEIKIIIIILKENIILII